MEIEKLARSVVENGGGACLVSFYYLRKFSKYDLVEKLKSEYPEVQWFLDSGAFTYYVRTQAGERDLPPVDRYQQQYFDYIDKYGHLFSRIAELDLDGSGVVSFQKVQVWFEEMLARWPHLPLCPVWHVNRGSAVWSAYCYDKRYQHLCIGTSSELEDSLTSVMVNEAHRYGKTVHGFAMTKIQTILKRVPYDSVDSTSWLLGQKFGTMYIFRAGKFIVLNNDNGGKTVRRKYWKYFENIGCDPRKIVLDDDVNEVRKANVIAWRNLSSRLDYMHWIYRDNNPDGALLVPDEFPVQREYAKERVHPDGWELGARPLSRLFLTPDEKIKARVREIQPLTPISNPDVSGFGLSLGGVPVDRAIARQSDGVIRSRPLLARTSPLPPPVEGEERAHRAQERGDLEVEDRRPKERKS